MDGWVGGWVGGQEGACAPGQRCWGGWRGDVVGEGWLPVRVHGKVAGKGGVAVWSRAAQGEGTTCNVRTTCVPSPTNPTTPNHRPRPRAAPLCPDAVDGQNAVLGAVLRGAGRQWLGAGLNLAGWWGVGVPLAYYLAFNCGMNVQGLWAGFATASALQAAVQLGFVLRFDWDNEVERAQAMVRLQDGGSGDSSSSSSQKQLPRGLDRPLQLRGESEQAELDEEELDAVPVAVTSSSSSSSGAGRKRSHVASAVPAGRHGACSAGAAGTAAALAWLPPRPRLAANARCWNISCGLLR